MSSVLPLVFSKSTKLSAISLTYSIDPITSLTINENSSLPFIQTNQIPAIQFDIAGTTGNISLSLSYLGKTYLGYIHCFYISSRCPNIGGEDSSQYSIVIYFITSDKTNIFIFIPINTTTATPPTNNFTNMNVILNDCNNTNLIDNTKSIGSFLFNTTNSINNTNEKKNLLYLNDLIPPNSYYIYDSRDNININSIVIFFKSEDSNLFIDSDNKPYLDNVFNNNTSNTSNNFINNSYVTAYKNVDDRTSSVLLYNSVQTTVYSPFITTSSDSSIYINCQPTDNTDMNPDNLGKSDIGWDIKPDQYTSMGIYYIFVIMAVILCGIFLMYGLFGTKNSDNSAQTNGRVVQALQELGQNIKPAKKSI
jgi:hypothetical protein